MKINKKAQYFSMLIDYLRGIERECLRVDENGHISQLPHPKSLGSALTHPYIKTDFSESQLELITPPLKGVKPLFEHLRNTHIFVGQRLGAEFLWPSSMPCFIEKGLPVPIAQYGTSNIAKMKTIYREGLKNRYGSVMQTISGIHYNFSFSEEFWKALHKEEESTESLQEFKSRRYMELIRNYHEMGWVISYLFGASPALCKSFLSVQNIDIEKTDLIPFDKKGTLTMKNATSLRMSGLGYQNKEGQKDLEVCYNTLESYVSCLEKAIHTKDPHWSKIGLKDQDGNYLQLSENVLQIENEYYGIIRPKRVGNKRPSLILKEKGIEYIELRNMDVNPFVSIGITEDQIRFLDVFVTYCLLKPVKYFDPKDMDVNKNNTQKVVTEGRDPNCTLQKEGHSILLTDWLKEIFHGCLELASFWDDDYEQTIKRLSQSKTFSERFMEEIKKSGFTFFGFSQALGQKHTKELQAQKLSPEDEKEILESVQKSIEEQEEIEKSDNLSLDNYIKAYFQG